ncbi:unnamed protein product, partial [Mesorhabditis belari]|uniref:Uncharacterized protein n=1 Tax=Mesorhabditis belari TaxID=2138241 RepID=A0AAF3E8J3_9BILA
MNIEKAEERAKEVEETRLHTATATVFLRPVIPVSPPIHPPPPPPTTEQQSQESQRVWSTMTTQIETSTSVKQWSTPAEKIVEGHPPGPMTIDVGSRPTRYSESFLQKLKVFDDKPSTLEGEARSGMLRGITPNYKLGTERPDSRIDLPHSGHIPNADGDYKVKQQQDHYKLTVIDPKVRSSANMPAYSTGVPDPRRSRAGDFPSEHTKRSFVKVDPLEQRKLKAMDTRAISTSAYLTESVQRHRDMEASRLKEYLRAKEGDANQPWNKPDWPGPRHQPPKNDESLRELDSIKERIATLQKKVQRSQSMQELMLIPPDEFARTFTPMPSASSTRDPGWLVKMRSNRYLEEVSQNIRKHLSMDQLGALSPRQEPEHNDINARPSGDDPLHWQLRKEFHLTKYSERRTSWQPSEGAPRVQPTISSLPERRRTHSGAPLYPPGSTDRIESESQPADRPLEPTVYENKPLPPSVIGVNVERETRQTRPSTAIGNDYPERLMSPPPNREPRGILKQSYSHFEAHQAYQSEMRETGSSPLKQHEQASRRPPLENGYEERPLPGTAFQELPEEERVRIMQENLQRHRLGQRATGASQPKLPASSFNGPFFKLEEVGPGGASRSRPQSVAPPLGSVTEMRESIEERDEGHFRSQQIEYSYEQSSQQLQKMRQMSASEVELQRHNESHDDPTAPSVVIWPPPSAKKERPRSQSVMSRSITDPDRIDEFRRQKDLEKEAIRRREDRLQRDLEKQVYAMELQQHRLYEQQSVSATQSPYPQQYQYPQEISYDQQRYSMREPYPPLQQYTAPLSPAREVPYTQPHAHDPGPPPPAQVRVFETRPLSAMSESGHQTSPQVPTWKRTYIVEKPNIEAKNEILTGDEVLEKDLQDVEIDILKRREAFVEKPELEPEIFRTGRRWQPPPERPYVWPTLRRPVSVDPTLPPRDFTPGPPHSPDDAGYQWAPLVYDPAYKKEQKNFTPQHSPPHSPIRGHGTGPLDEPAKRQTRYLVKPAADGSHRPRPAFGGPRHTPSGGFYPHAPNAIKVIKRPNSPNAEPQIEIIHQRNFHRLDEIGSPTPRASTSDRRTRKESYSSSQIDRDQLQDWEKIYDLPPHSSQIVSKEVPQHVDVKRRLAHFEESARRITGRMAARALSLTHLDQVPPPDYDEHPGVTVATLPHRRSERQAHHHHQNYQHEQHASTARRENREEREVRRHRERQLIESERRRAAYMHGLARESRQSQHDRHRSYESAHSSQHHQVARRESSSSSRVGSPMHTGVPIRHSSHSQRHQQPSRSQSRLSQPTTIALSPQPRSETPGAARVRSKMAVLTGPSPPPPSYERARRYLPPPLPEGYRLTDPGVDPRATSPSQGNTQRLVRSVQEQARSIAASPTPAPGTPPGRVGSSRDPRSPNPRYL